ncbi:MobV family relaxase [Vibrio parahaemolyticus]|uniref:MobV family relaxase n=1 Tax=Vibrio parahaemolyticus TaxID=670 RepID=UPI001D162526|nr:MobV family relaxase [Vibrio parahaemolyticus]
MNRVVGRIKKHKYNDLKKVDEHNKRKTPQKNVDPNGKHFVAYSRYGDVTLQEALDKRISEIPVDQRTKIVKQGTHATSVVVEFVISATPTYFRENADDHGVYDVKKTKEWIAANIDYLKNKYGDNLLNVHVHLDEKTPHLHAEVTPIVTKERNRRRTAKQKRNNESAGTYTVQTFDAKNMFDKFSLIKLQDELAESVKHLGIERGIRKLKVDNIPMKEIYKTLDDAKKDAINLARKEVGKFKLNKPSRFQNLDNYVSEESERVNKYRRSVFSKLKKAYQLIAKLRFDLTLEKKRVEKFANFFGGSIEEADQALDDIQTTFKELKQDNDDLKASLEQEKLQHQSTQKQLENSLKHIEKIEQLTDEDRMIYRMNKTMKGKDSALTR